MAGSARRLRQLPMRAAFALDGELVDHLGVDLDLFAEPPVLVGESASWPAQRQERQGVRGCRRALAKGRGLSLPRVHIRSRTQPADVADVHVFVATHRLTPGGVDLQRRASRRRHSAPGRALLPWRVRVAW
jgi:hypothetical protein